MIKITLDQTRDECASPALPCFNDTDCKLNELPIYIEKELCKNYSNISKVMPKHILFFYFFVYLGLYCKTMVPN